MKRDKKVISQSFNRVSDFVFEKGKGVYVWDLDGNKYLDFAAGIAVNSVGYCNKEVEQAIHHQLKKGIHCGFTDFCSALPVQFAEELITCMPQGFNNVFLSNSGTESIEAAFKCAKWHTNKTWTIAYNNCFHGRTLASLSMTNSKPVQRERFGPFLPVKHVTYPYVYRSGYKDEETCTMHCLEELERTIHMIHDDVSALFIESIQGEGGYIVPPKKYMQELRKLCTEHDILLCADEVQAGCFRTGTFLAMNHFNVRPDIVSLSKAIAGGMPLGATVANKKIMDWPPGSHGNTFGGNLLASAAGIATLKFMKRHNLGVNAKVVGDMMLKRLHEMKEEYKIIGDVRGMGLMIGVEMVKDKRSKKYGIEEAHHILCHALDKGLVLLEAGKSVIRFCPPLIITKEEAMQGLDIFETCVKEANKL